MKAFKHAVLLIITLTLALSGIVWTHPHDSHDNALSGLGSLKAKLCLEDLDKWVVIDPLPAGPVGCEAIDRCPGCPGPPWDIEVEITVKEPVFESLTFLPVSLTRPTEALKLSGLELIPAGQTYAGGLRMLSSRGTISGISVDKPGRSGGLRPLAKFRKDAKAGSYSIEVIQRFAETSKLIRKDQLVIELDACGSSKPACEANPITSELLQHVYGKHSPIYPRAYEPVTYTAFARGKVAEGVGVSRLSLEVRQFRLTNNNGSLVPTPVNIFTRSEAFPANPIEAEISLILGPFPSDTWIKYKAETVLADGTRLTDSAIRHAANLREPTIAAFNGAVPVYKRGTHADKFDILFIPDIDYGVDEDAYLNDVEEFVYDGFFTDPPYRYKRFRRYLNISINMLRSGLTGDAEDLSADPKLVDKPDNFDGEPEPRADLTWVDVAVIAHQDSFRDWAQLGLAEGRFCTADAAGTATHETLHALMSQRDEYEGQRSQLPIEHPNIFDSQEACEAHVAEHPGFSPGHCKKGPGDSNFWHWCKDLNDDHGHIMDVTAGPFMVEERCQVAWAVDNLLGNPQGSKYGPVWVYGCAGFPCDASTRKTTASAAGDAEIPEEDTFDEDRGYTEADLFAEMKKGKALLLSVILTEDKASLRKAALQQGPSPNLGATVLFKGREKEAPFRVQLLKGNKIVKEFPFTNPRLVAGEEGEEELKETVWDIRLPFDEKLKVDRLRVVDNQERIVLDSRVRLGR